MEALRIFGARVRAQLVVDFLAWHFADRYVVKGYYDDRLPVGSEGPGGFLVSGSTDQGCREMMNSQAVALLAIGTRASARGCEMLARLRQGGVRIASLVSPQAHVSPSARIGDNAVVTAGVLISGGAQIGHLFTAHGGATIEHHARIGHNVLFGPGATCAGFVTIESHCFIGAGAVIMPEVRIGAGTLVGAGSAVLEDLPPGVVAWGCPARPVRATTADDEVPTAAQIRALSQSGFEGGCG